MSDSYEIARFLENLRRRGFAVTRLAARGRYLIGTPGSTRRLVLDSTLFDEYFDAAYAHWRLPAGSIDRGEEILSLMVADLEAALRGVDDQVTEVGLRRGTSGVAEWYRIEQRAGGAQTTGVAVAVMGGRDPGSAGPPGPRSE